MIQTTQHYLFKLFTLLFLFHTSTQALDIKYIPVMVYDIPIFVPVSTVTVSLEEDQVITEGEDVVLNATINLPTEVVSYAWSEGSTVLGTASTFSTATLSILPLPSQIVMA